MILQARRDFPHLVPLPRDAPIQPTAGNGTRPESTPEDRARHRIFTAAGEPPTDEQRAAKTRGRASTRFGVRRSPANRVLVLDGPIDGAV
ncbi:hypothetical protein QE430_003369 [Microbacterium testaceum]|nr:hypothetical protein [Microbacterium testaceum]